MYSEEDIRRLRWQARRGMLELDLLLEPFIDEVFRDLDAADQKRFVDLLACEDQDLFVWFMQRETPQDPDIKAIVSLMLNCVQPSSAQV